MIDKNVGQKRSKAEMRSNMSSPIKSADKRRKLNSAESVPLVHRATNLSIADKSELAEASKVLAG